MTQPDRLSRWSLSVVVMPLGCASLLGIEDYRTLEVQAETGAEMADDAGDSGVNDKCFLQGQCFPYPPEAGSVSSASSDSTGSSLESCWALDSSAHSGSEGQNSQTGDTTGLSLSFPDTGLAPEAGLPAIDVDGGSPRLGGACGKSGARACNGAAQDQLLLCNSGHWDGNGVCDTGKYCNQLSGRCVTVPERCEGATADTSYCNGTERIVCGDDLLGIERESCAGRCEESQTTASCIPVVCGDFVKEGNEVCDDGNSVTDAACPYGSPTCSRCDSTCSVQLSLSGPYCGDGMVTDGEGCDASAPWCQACKVKPDISLGSEHSCAVLPTGGVKCWGRGDEGQLGNGESEDQLVTVDVVGLTAGVARVSAGGSHTCALTQAGSIKCWGSNYGGNLGNGSEARQLVPVDVEGLTEPVTSLAAGASHTCARLASGAVKCWGMNDYGQLGDGTYENRTTPVGVVGLSTGAAAVATGPWALHTCAIMESGAASCWGENSGEQLGSGSFPGDGTSNTPREVLGRSGIVAMAMADYTCALLAPQGTIDCWGIDAVYLDSSEGLTSGFAGIAVGAVHMCGLTLSGGAKCWGSNNHGAVGDGSSEYRDTPVDVTGLTRDVAIVAAGFIHSCAFLNTGGVRCWGEGEHGQLGNNDVAMQRAPVEVVGFP